MNNSTPVDPANRQWTRVGLVLALFAIPLVVGIFNVLQIPVITRNVLVRELAIFAFAALLAFIIRKKENLGWSSVGLQRPPLGNTLLWVLITLGCVAVALALAFGGIKLMHWPFGSGPGAAAFAALPLWVVLIVVIRAGFVEEFFYRGYVLERLSSMTGSMRLAVAISLTLFAIFHYRQGWAGILIALLTGAVLTWVYLRKRNLWIGIITHFLVDFIPNVLLPLVSSSK